MPWDITIRSPSASLGSLDLVREIISRICPSAKFGTVPSGVEKVRLAEVQGIQFPSVIRESMISQPAKHEAGFEADGVSFSFRFGSKNMVNEIGLEVRGEGDPFPWLRQLAGVGGWQVVDDATGKLLSANAQAAGTGWQKYQKLLAQARDQEQ